MKKNFENPAIEIISMSVVDVITTSGEITPPGENETPDW